MNDVTMFAPLPPATAHQDVDRADKVPIIPVPPDAPRQEFRHPVHGYPTTEWEYRLANGELVGYVCRFDFERNGVPDKELLPVTYCEHGNGRRSWRAKGIPAPRPLYRLADIAARPGVPKIVCEGEKSADAGADWFPNCVTTTPMHGAKSPQKTDWSPLAGEQVIIWPDNDNAGADFARRVAALATQAGARSVAIVAVPPHWPKKWDLADPLPDGVEPELLGELLKTALPWLPRLASPAVDFGRKFISVGAYTVTARGLYFDTGVDDASKIWLSAAFEVLAQTRDQHGSQWGLLLRWIDEDGGVHEWAMPREALGGGRDEIWRTLSREGLRISSTFKNRNLLADYLSQVRPDGRACGLSRIGWHSVGGHAAFVMPDATYGNISDERIVWQSESRSDSFFLIRGTLDGWRSEVAMLCIGNSRLVFAVSAAFAPPLLMPADEQSGGFHLLGVSQTGKTSVLRAAGSAWGGGGSIGFARTWRATANGLEGIAEAHNDALLCLDEMGQVDAREAGEVAYLLANGVGKGRAGQTGLARRSAQWRLIFLSTGELSLAEKMAEIGKMPKAGQEVRLVNIPADAGAGCGVFENLHGAASGGVFAERIRAASGRQYGTAIRQYLAELTARYGTDTTGLHDVIKSRRDAFIATNLPLGASGQVRSVCGRAALVAVAGELATAFGLTGWPEGEAEHAAAVCFRAWLAKRGSAGDYEIEAGIRQVVNFVEAHGSSRFEAAWETSHERISNRVGFRHYDDETQLWRFYVLPGMWDREVAKGFDPRALTRAMVERGLIIPGKDGKPATQKKIPGFSNKKVYELSPDIIGSATETDDNM